jgi:hypothetical protein
MWSDALQVLHRCSAIYRDVGTRPGCDRQVAAQDRRTGVLGNFLEAHVLATPVAKDGMAAGSPYVSYPVPPSYSAITTGNEIERPLRRPWTSSVATRFGHTPAAKAMADALFCIFAKRFGRPPLYSHRK